MPDKVKLMEPFSSWFSSIRWEVAGTLEFRDSVSPSLAWESWIDAVRIRDVTNEFRYVLETHRDDQHENTQCNVLLGGLAEHNVRRLARLWREHAGRAHLKYYKYSENAVRDFLETMPLTERFEIELRFFENILWSGYSTY